MNTQPIFPLTPSVQWPTTALTAANTVKDGTGTVLTAFTADSTNGSRLDFLKVRALGTNVATVLRVFINNGGSNTVAANNVLYTERSLASSVLSESSELADVVIGIGISLPAGYRINLTLGTAIAAGVAVTAVGGHY